MLIALAFGIAMIPVVILIGIACDRWPRYRPHIYVGFLGSLAGLAVLAVVMDAPLRHRSYRIKTLAPQISQCVAGNGGACFSVATKYRDGVSGFCSSRHGLRNAPRSRVQCDFLPRDGAAAIRYGAMACDLGWSAGCEIAGRDPMPQAEQRAFCIRGALGACDALLGDLASPALHRDAGLIAHLTRLCAGGNMAACLYDLRDMLTGLVMDEPDLSEMSRAMVASMVIRPQNPPEAEALISLTAILSGPDLGRAMVSGDAALTGRMLAQIAAIPMPPLAAR
ncbi:MAG: hypothetical protein Q4G26_13305 [Paracoccus sp. (in: a-proteobacteria)]|nr:hypothetical protein [Paracoccus sp. (in: a-proteobacteria)]